VERILAAQARPRSAMETLAIEAQEHLNQILRQSPLPPRSTADYQGLLEQTAKHDENDEDNEREEPVA
jgi:hypothetical protein